MGFYEMSISPPVFSLPSSVMGGSSARCCPWDLRCRHPLRRVSTAAAATHQRQRQLRKKKCSRHLQEASRACSPHPLSLQTYSTASCSWLWCRRWFSLATRNVSPMVSNFSTSQYVARNAACADRFPAPHTYRGICGAVRRSATWKGLPGTCVAMKRWTDLHLVVACRIACGSAHSPPTLSMSAGAFQITTSSIAAGRTAALHATDGVGSRCDADASAAVSAAARAPHPASSFPPLSRFAFPPRPAVFCTDPPTAVAPQLVALPVFPTAKTGASLAGTPPLPLQARQVSPVLSLSLPHPAAGQQRWFRSLPTLQNISVFLRDIDDRQQPRDRDGRRQSEHPYQDLPHAEQQQQPQQHQRYPKQQQQQHQLYRRVQQHSYVITRGGQLVVQEHWWNEQWDPHYALHVPLFRQELQKRYLRGRQRQQHEFQEPASGQRQRLGETKHITDQLQRRKGKEQLLSQSRGGGGGAQAFFVCCSSTQLPASLMPPLMHYGDLPSSRLLLFRKKSSGVLSAAGVRCFSTTMSERLTREMERRLLRQGENTGMGTAAVYNRRRQGIVLAVADDVLLARGLAAAPVGTLVTFTHTGDGQAAATAPTAAAGDRRQAPPAANVAEVAAAAGRAAEAQTGVGGTRDAGSEEEPAAPVLGVVLQLLQQDLNVLGLLGGSSNFSSSTGECLPFRVPRIGDLCTAVSAYVGQSPQLQQDAPAQAQQSQRGQCTQNAERDRRRVQQQEGRQPKQKQRKPYQLMDSISPDCSSRVVSPMTLLHRVVPATETADQDSKASISEVFLNVLDFFQPIIPKTCPSTDVKLPWGLPTGSAAVDAVAPLQVGETSAFVGPPGTGKTHALVPAVALHAAAAAAAAVVDASPAASSRLLPTAASETTPEVTVQTGRTQPQQKLSVVFLSLGSSSSSLRRWLDAVSRETAECSAAVCARNAAWEAAHREDLMTAARPGDKTEDASSSAALPSRWASTVGAADAFSAYVERAAPRGTKTSTVSTPLKNMVVLHVPAPSVTVPEAAAAGAAAEKTDLCGRRVHPTSTLMYLAPVLALRLTLEAQAVAAAHGTPCPVLLAIDGLTMHASAVTQLQVNIQKLLSSQSAALHVPAALAGLSPPGAKMPLPPGAAAGSSAAAAAAVALPFSATSLYGMLSCRTSRATGATGPLSMLLVLDTPADPALLTARNLQRSASSLVQQQRIEETLHQTIKGEDSVGVNLSQKLAREVQEALLSTAQRTILFAMSTQQQRRGQSAAQAAHKAVQREQQQQRQQRMKARTEAGHRGGVPLGRIYPMIDIDSVVASSTAALSADACAALSQSCFTRRDSPTAQEDVAAQEALRDAIEALCRRQLRAEKHLLHSTSSSRIPDIAHMTSTTSEGTAVGTKAATGTGKLLFEPPALLAAAGAAFAWQRRVLHSESERQQLMQQFRLFVDIWEEEDVDSLSIASAVCLARPVGRIFSPTEQLVLLRAAATMVFTPFGAPSATGEREGGGRAGRGSAAASASPGLEGGGAESRQNDILSFAQICAFQEDLLHEFREKEPLLWDDVQQHLHRAGDWPMQLRSEELDTANTKATKEGLFTLSTPHQEETSQENTGLQTVGEEEEQVQHMARHVMGLINRVDKALLDMRSSFDITSPCFPDD